MRPATRSKILRQFKPLNDAHCHFFSARFFEILGSQLRPEKSAAEVVKHLGWDWPGTPAELAQHWTQEMDQHQVRRCALMASLPGDWSSVEEAVSCYPERLVGFFMVDPTAGDAITELPAALARGKLQVPCLFPAMHRYRLDSREALAVIEAASRMAAPAVFVHCGQLSIGVRKKLGLPSHFDSRLGNPQDLYPALADFPNLRFIIPHFGAGALTETLMLAASHPNIYLDTSSSNNWIKFYPGLTLQQVFAQALQVVGVERLLFGSDSSFFPRGWHAAIYQQQSQLVKGLGVSPREQDLIFRGNFERLFPVPAKTAKK